MLKKLCLFMIFLLIFCFSAALPGNEVETPKYFPAVIGSYWVYVDQDGNELTRRAIEGEEIAGEIYHGFSYEPELEDWKDFNRYMFPSLYNIGEEWVTFLVGDEVEKAVKARLTKEMETFTQLAKKTIETNAPSEFDITFNLNYDVEVEAEGQFYLLDIQATLDEEWDATQISARITMEFDIQGLPDFQGAAEIPIITLGFNIRETGKIINTETVETAAGTFEDCLKIEYQTETEMIASEQGGPENQPGESVTTLWLALNIGIVKFHQEAEKMFMHTMSERELVEASVSEEEAAEIIAASVKTFELKKYEIAPDVSQDDNSN